MSSLPFQDHFPSITLPTQRALLQVQSFPPVSPLGDLPLQDHLLSITLLIQRALSQVQSLPQVSTISRPTPQNNSTTYQILTRKCAESLPSITGKQPAISRPSPKCNSTNLNSSVLGAVYPVLPLCSMSFQDHLLIINPMNLKHSMSQKT